MNSTDQADRDYEELLFWEAVYLAAIKAQVPIPAYTANAAVCERQSFINDRDVERSDP